MTPTRTQKAIDWLCAHHLAVLAAPLILWRLARTFRRR